MRRMISFASRNIKELLRDPLSYIFCLGFPIVMLAAMTAINSMIPTDPTTGAKAMDLFEAAKLTPGIAVFGMSFIMLFATLSVSKDRSTALITRLRTSPMTAFDFIAGYALPLTVMAIGQTVITVLAGLIVGLTTGSEYSFARSLLLIPAMLPCALFFIGIGIIFGTLFSEKAAPPCSSIIISLCGLLGGIWFSLDTIPEGNFFGTLCKILPFRHPVDLGRAIMAGDSSAFTVPLVISAVYGVVTVAAAVLVFGLRMKKDAG